MEHRSTWLKDFSERCDFLLEDAILLRVAIRYLTTTCSP